MSASSFVGLKVTLESTLEIFNYLKDTFGVTYLMTSRLNQDALEVFIHSIFILKPMFFINVTLISIFICILAIFWISQRSLWVK